MRKTLLDNDKLNTVGLRPAGNAAMALVDAASRFTSEQQVIGAAAYFLLLCQRYRVDSGEAFRVASRVIAAQHEGRPELAAVQAYMEHELK